MNIEPIVADGRCLGAFDGDRLVGSALFHDMRQWWYGRAVPMAGVAAVMIAPEDRGRGVGRAVDDGADSSSWPRAVTRCRSCIRRR